MFKNILVAIIIASSGCVFHDHDDADHYHYDMCYYEPPAQAPDYCSSYYNEICCEWYDPAHGCWDEYCNWGDYCGWEYMGCYI